MWLVVLVYIALIIGAFKLLMFILGIFTWIFRHCCRCKQNLHTKYAKVGADSYAVVTGGSDGLGYELCRQLAEQEFNICIVSRNKQKIDEKLAEISKDYPNIKTMAVVADLSKMTTVASYRELI